MALGLGLGLGLGFELSHLRPSLSYSRVAPSVPYAAPSSHPFLCTLRPPPPPPPPNPNLASQGLPVAIKMQRGGDQRKTSEAAMRSITQALTVPLPSPYLSTLSPLNKYRSMLSARDPPRNMREAASLCAELWATATQINVG